MNTELLIAYTITAFFYITSPGPAVLLAIVDGLTAGMRTVVIASLANSLGLAVLSVASILGLGLLLQTSALLFLIVKLIGVAYFLYLGVKFLFNKKTMNLDVSSLNDHKQRTAFSYFREAFLIAVTNPKPILFFTAIFPQFLDTNNAVLPQFALMTAIFLSISFGSLCTYGYLSGKSKKWIQSPTKMRWFNRITGGLFIGLGVGLLQMKPSN